ncbi:25.3 kDa vesicle transport protein-like [Papaver somniferum]|uniref:25.3 kDa vesicle transport protein-like n=1 Tax=Papaver somniferum TaxID=3469 RepID=UPI000E6FB09E|nr:25.3 kDa vesicle transport protein-like [Papaver somniferum]
MVKLTVVGRAYDGLPVAHFPRVKNEEDMSMLFYKQQAEFIVKEICRGALLPSKMSMNIDDQYCFNYLIEKGISYITLCESSYPRYLAFQYLQDLNKEIEKLDTNFLHTLTKPYSFIKFDNVIAKIRRRYLDTRTQANLSILNANLRQDLDVIIEDISKIIEDRKRSVIH